MSNVGQGRSLLLLALLLLLCACTDSGMPRSGGRPYEVLVTGSDSAANKQLASRLQALVMEGLPQEEPLLDVSVITADGLTQGTRYARNLVVVTTGDSASHAPSRLAYERNAFAEPQLLVSTGSTGTENARAIASLVVRAELNNGIASLRKKHNASAAARIDSTFGCRLWVPEDLTRSKQGQDFLWLSNDGVRAMQNICVYRYAASSLSEEQLRHKTDSILQANIPGETDDMWMQLAHSTARREGQRLELRGLWEMRGDAMGGPFVSHSLQRGDSIVTAMAFVYAPGEKKRNIVRRLEAALYTLK